jgi:hypothetical protein
MILWLAPAAAASPSGPCNPLDPGCDAGGHVDDGKVVYGGGGDGAGSDPGPPPSTSVSSEMVCSYRDVDPDFDRGRVVHTDSRIPMNAVFYWRECAQRAELLWYVPGDPRSHDALDDLIQRVLDSLSPAAPELVTSPPVGSEVLTGLPMYLAVDDGAFSEQSGSVSAGQFTVTAVVRPVQTRFEPGDGGDPRSCDGAGSVWSWGDRPSESDCVHVFTHTPADVFGHGRTFEIAGQVEYEASYTVEGPVLAGTYELGMLEGPRTTLQVPVVERRAVRTTAG